MILGCVKSTERLIRIRIHAQNHLNATAAVEKVLKQHGQLGVAVRHHFPRITTRARQVVSQHLHAVVQRLQRDVAGLLEPVLLVRLERSLPTRSTRDN